MLPGYPAGVAATSPPYPTYEQQARVSPTPNGGARACAR